VSLIGRIADMNDDPEARLALARSAVRRIAAGDVPLAVDHVGEALARADERLEVSVLLQRFVAEGNVGRGNSR